MWARAIAQLIGFTSIAMSYFVAGRYQGTSRRSYSIILLGATGLILCVFGFLLIVFNPLDLASIYSSTRIFTIVNIALLSYIILFLYRKIKPVTGEITSLVGAPLAFFCLWLGQFSFLVYSMVNNNAAILIGSQVARIVGFVFFVLIYYLARKESKSDAFG